MEINLDIKYIYIINSDLKMSKGKIAAQVSHVAMQLGEYYIYVGRAIILKAPEQKIRELKELFESRFDVVDMFYIEDAGLTEVPAGSLTCIGLKETPATKEFTKYLKLV